MGWALSLFNSTEETFYDRKESTHNKLLWKHKEANWCTFVTTHLRTLLSAFSKEANKWQIATFWREGWSRQGCLHYLESRQMWHQEAQTRVLPSPARPCLQQLWLPNKWLRDPCLRCRPLFKTSQAGSHARLTCYLLAGLASFWQVKSALFPPKRGGHRAAHHLQLLKWRGKRCRGSGQQKQPANCTLGCPVLGWLLFFPWEDLTKPNPASSKYQTGSYM